MKFIGIDSGTSITKIIEYSNNKIINKYITPEKNTQIALDKFLEDNNIDINHIDKIVLTGIGADKFNSNKYKEKIEKVEEFTAIGFGGLYQSRKKEVIVASIGTGTAFVKSNNNKIEHLGGTGVGGGTFLKLSEKITGINSFEKILKESEKGNLKNVDLQIGDIINKEIGNLSKEITSSNFGKLNNNTSNSDILLGIVNMIFETVGVMAAFLAKNTNIEEVVLIGTMTTHPFLKEVIKKLETLHNVKFFVPENPEFSCAIGAIESYKKHLTNIN